jgi:adenine-specific DNA-methyltransferase
MAKKDYSKLTKEQLLEVVEKLESKKNVGLYWDEARDLEKVVMDCKDKLPVLKEVKGKQVTTDLDETTHILIEGDNYHALSVLNYTHKSKIDLIYIDPPYNTGKTDFKYNDKYIDEVDDFRHSKWLNFMKSRLELAKDLLKDEGVIFMSIGNDELYNLKLLSDKIFPEFLSLMVRQGVKGGTRSKSVISANQDYLLVYAKNKKNCLSGQVVDSLPLDQEDAKGKFRKGRELNKWGAGSAREDAPKMYFPVPGPNGEDVYPIRNDGSEGRWRWGLKKMMKASADKELIFERRDNGTYIVYQKIRDEAQREIAYSSLLINSEFSNANGTEELKVLFGNRIPFSYPKPTNLIKHILKMINTESAIVLDFFAGSGTLGQAVLEFNLEEGTTHQFIVSTNNEVDKKTEEKIKLDGIEKGTKEYETYGICQAATYPRLKKVMKGFEYDGEIKEELFSEKINLTKLKMADKLLEIVGNIKEKQKDKYKEIKTSLDDGILKVVGTKEIKGKFQGLGNNLKYFRTSFVANNRNKDQLKIDITKRCTEMLCLKEGIFNLIKEEADYKIFQQGKRYLAVYYDFANVSLEELKVEMNNLKGEKVLYCFTVDNHGLDKASFSGWKNIRLEPIPQKILDVYKRIFKN